VVSVTPDEISLIYGSPAVRRRFLDFAAAQHTPMHAQNLSEYQKVLEQRNQSLRELKRDRGKNGNAAEIWDDQLVDLGSQIILERIKLLDQISPLAENEYAQISGHKENLNLQYASSFQFADRAGLGEKFSSALKQSKSKEEALGFTLVGPHRDELELKIDSQLIRDFGSFGQARSAMLALKLAQLECLQKKKSEPPLLILDEVFSDLDQKRSRYLVRLLDNQKQVFIATSKEWELPQELKSKSVFVVQDGQVQKRELK
jgi:DNA replication and repair protein RecF